MAEMWQTLKAGNTWIGNLVSKHKDGTDYTDQVTVYPMLDQQGHVSHYVGIQTKIPKIDQNTS